MKRLFLVLVIPIIFITSCGKDMEKKTGNAKKESYTLISYYETKIYDKIEDRITNLTICANALNGTVINPNEEFSFNKTVGERTEEKGYKNAITYDENGEKKMDLGGGICQISSAIHMAAKKVGLIITERHDHKKEVPYEQPGNDAAVFYNKQDFKFINNSDKTLKLEVIINNEESVIINIYKRED